jgi:RNA polymerase sigma-B factor
MSTANSETQAAQQRQQRNQCRLLAYAGSHDPRRRRVWRDALVVDNLPLVHTIAGRLARQGALPFDDLVQVGSLGLMRAIETFDPKRQAQLSTLAVPYIQGAILHELRDRQHLMRVPRSLWELRQRQAKLQQQRCRQGLPPLGEAALAQALGCAPQLLREVRELAAVTAVRSLDAPRSGGEDGESPGSLLEQLAAPASPGSDAGPGDGETVSEETAAELRWLRGALAQLDPLIRELLEGRILHGCTWVELGNRLGLHPRQAQRRCLAAQAALQRAGASWRDGLSRSAAPTRAAAASPATPPAGSAGHSPPHW